MNKLKLIALFLVLGIGFSCEEEEEQLTQEEEAQNLSELLIEIEDLASSVVCNDPSEWAISPIGSKACGGPAGFIAYSVNIDVPLFLQKIEVYRRATEEFNRKWEIISDCSLAVSPSGIACEDGKPVFIR